MSGGQVHPWDGVRWGTLYTANSDLLMTGPERTHLFQLNHQKGVGKCNDTHISLTQLAFILQT